MTKTPDEELAATIHPDIALLAKIGSIIAHIEEARGAGGHPFDSCLSGSHP